MDKNGVGYITKNNKEEQRTTKYADSSVFLPGQASGLKVNDARGEEASLEENFSSQVGIICSTPLSESNVLRSITQLWDNGEQAKQRYKLKVRLNLTDGSSVDFIAPLTKDPRNFIKHTADRDLARQWRDQSIQQIRKNYGVRPWLGKFHMVQNSYSSKYQKLAIEPNCFATVWWDEEAREWSATIIIYNFAQEEIDMQSRNVSKAQWDKGCRSSRLWVNPQHDKTKRPLTWAETVALHRQQQENKNG